MELRLGQRARATKDVDAMLRSAADIDEIGSIVREALAAPLGDGSMTFAIQAISPIGQTGAVRFDVQVLWRGRVISNVKLEVSAAEAGVATRWDDVDSFGAARQFGIDAGRGTVACIPIRYQIAQKLHAVSDPRPGNDRFRDLIDILLLDGLTPSEDATLRVACLEIFAARAAHAWPPRLVAHSDWARGYEELAVRLEFPVTTLGEAIEAVETVVDRIDSTPPTGSST